VDDEDDEDELDDDEDEEPLEKEEVDPLVVPDADTTEDDEDHEAAGADATAGPPTPVDSASCCRGAGVTPLSLYPPYIVHGAETGCGAKGGIDG
jgi:hypothetical protein